MRFKILLILLALTSCASPVKKIKEDKDLLNSSDKGYILLGVDTNYDLKSIVLHGPRNIRLTRKDLRKGSNYLLIDVKAGVYDFNRVNFDGYWILKMRDSKELWQVEIKPNQVNYVGHLILVKRGFWNPIVSVELLNYSSNALEYMEKNFPSILSQRKMVFGGVGNDDFFNLATGKE